MGRPSSSMLSTVQNVSSGDDYATASGSDEVLNKVGDDDKQLDQSAYDYRVGTPVLCDLELSRPSTCHTVGTMQSMAKCKQPLLKSSSLGADWSLKWDGINQFTPRLICDGSAVVASMPRLSVGARYRSPRLLPEELLAYVHRAAVFGNCTKRIKMRSRPSTCIRARGMQLDLVAIDMLPEAAAAGEAG